jgi:hypothetical protein
MLIVLGALGGAAGLWLAHLSDAPAEGCFPDRAATIAELVKATICSAGADPTTTESQGTVRIIYSLRPWSLTASVVRNTFYRQIQRIVPLAFARDASVNKVDIVGTGPLKDLRGNESEGYLFHVTFTRANASGIRWDNIDVDNIPRIADGAWEHPSLSR